MIPDIINKLKMVHIYINDENPKLAKKTLSDAIAQLQQWHKDMQDYLKAKSNPNNIE